MGLDGDVWVQIVLAGFDDGDDKVGAKVGLFEEAGVAGGFEAEELRGASGVEVAKSVGEVLVFNGSVSSLSVSLHFFFLSFLHLLSDPISFSLFFLSFFLSFPQQTETIEIKENSSTKWGWLQGTPDHEPRLADAPISRPFLSSTTNICLALNCSSAEIHNYLKPISISFLRIFKS